MNLSRLFLPQPINPPIPLDDDDDVDDGGGSEDVDLLFAVTAAVEDCVDDDDDTDDDSCEAIVVGAVLVVEGTVGCEAVAIAVCDDCSLPGWG